MKLGGTSIFQYSEIVGIADELFRLIRMKKSDPSIDSLAQMMCMFYGFSLPVVQAFRSVFYKDEEE